VFTTGKLAVLMQSGLVPAAATRRQLVDQLASRGHGLTVHGVDAWFKRNDSNYGVERESLSTDAPTYPLPRRRWPALLSIFDVDARLLEMTDAEFSSWVHSELERRKGYGRAEARGEVVVAVDDRPSIAVMSFDCEGVGREDGRLVADGIAQDLVTQLARVPELFVVSRASTRRLDHASWDVAAIGRALGVRSLLEGRIQLAGYRIRVGVQLVDALNGSVVWSDTFDADRDEDLFAVQDRIVFQICAHLDPRIRLRPIERGSRSGSMAVWRLSQEGWFRLFVDPPVPAPEYALALFRKAHDLDRECTLAQAGIAVALATGMLWGGVGPEYFHEAQLHVTEASRRLPDHPAVLYAMAMVAFLQPIAISTPLEYAQRAVDLEPSNAMYRAGCGYLKANIGMAAEGVADCLEAIRLAPLDAREPFLSHMLAGAYLTNREYEKVLDALTACRRHADVDVIGLQAAFAHFELGDRAAALEDLRRISRPRSHRFYTFSITRKVWANVPMPTKKAFLELLTEAGIA